MNPFVYRLKVPYKKLEVGTVIAEYNEKEKQFLQSPGNAERIPFAEAEIPQNYLEILKNKNLLDILADEAKKKIVGEQETIKTILLVAQGRLVENKKATSDNLVVNSESGAGKDWILNNTLALLPKEQVIKRTRISEAVFTYWHNAKYEEDWTWDGKVFYNEDVSQKIFNSDVVKTMSSGKTHSTIVVKQRAVDIQIEGKPTMFFTFAKTNPQQEMLRRYPICTLDESEKQTDNIMDREAEAAVEGILSEYNEELIEAQTYLKRIKVKIPFAKTVRTAFQENNLIFRTQFGRFLDYIKFSCSLHQFQREKDEEGFYLAEAPMDYENARLALLKTTTNKFMIPVTKEQNKILNIMEKFYKEFTRIEEIASKITFMGDTAIRTNLNILADFGFLEKDTQKEEGIPKPVLVYSFGSFEDISIPTWKELTNRNSENTENSLQDRKYKTSENSKFSISKRFEQRKVHESDIQPIDFEIIDHSGDSK